MPLEHSKSEAAFHKNVGELISSGHPRAQALAAAYAIKSGRDFSDADSSRQYDLNGWPEIKANPLSKEGVFPYLGKQVGPEFDPEEVVMVYRPGEELANPSCIDSFKLIPWVNIHPDNLLGRESDGRVDVSEKPVEGVTGENIYFDNGVLYGNIKMFSDNLQELVDSGEHKELSLGYGCRYEIKSGIWNGQRYRAIQRDIRGNHLAAVPQGRMGPDVAVLDHFKVTFDAKDIQMTTKPNKANDADTQENAGEGELSMDDVMSWMKENGPKMQKMQALCDKHFGKASDAEETEEEKTKKKEAADKSAKDAEEKEAADKRARDAEEEEKKKKGEGMDAAITTLRTQVEDMRKGGIKAILGEIKHRDDLASRLSNFTGAFDASEMTLAEVAEYGVKKLGLSAPKGSETVALDAYMTGRKPATEDIGFSFDARGANGNAASAKAVNDFYNA